MIRKYKGFISLFFALLFSFCFCSFSAFADDSFDFNVVSSLYSCDKNWNINDRLFSVSGLISSTGVESFDECNYCHEFSITRDGGSVLDPGYELSGKLQFFYYCLSKSEQSHDYNFYLVSCINAYIELVYTDGSHAILDDCVNFDGSNEEFIIIDFAIAAQARSVSEIKVVFTFDNFNFFDYETFLDEFGDDECSLRFGFYADDEDPLDLFLIVDTSINNNSIAGLLSNVGIFFNRSVEWVSFVTRFIVSNSALLLLIFSLIVSSFVVGLLNRIKQT